MEKVTIQEASRRLNVSQRDIREYIRNGRLKAERDPDSSTGRWLVEMPEDGWEDDFKSFLNDMSANQTPWWWAFERKTGRVHYLLQVGIEEIMPDFLCGLRGENLYPANGHTPDQRCPELPAGGGGAGAATVGRGIGGFLVSRTVALPAQ